MAVEYDRNYLTLCEENDRSKSGWNVCCAAYDLEEAGGLAPDPEEYTVTIKKEYSGTDGNTAADLVITLTSTEDATKKYEFTKDDETGEFTCNKPLPKGTYNISETGTDIDGYTWNKKPDPAEITIPTTAGPSQQNLIETYWGGGFGPVDPGSGCGGGGTTTPEEPKATEITFKLTNTYTEDHVPAATGATKTVVRMEDNLPFTLDDDDDANITRPSKNDKYIVIKEGTESVTLLYKITVTGEAGASFTVTDENTTLAYSENNAVTPKAESNGVYTGTLTGTSLDFYVTKEFQPSDFSADSGNLTNKVTLAGTPPMKRTFRM